MNTPTSDSRDLDGVLESEFEHIPVPSSHRRTLLSVSSIWLGFPMVLLCAVLGGVVTGFLGFKLGLLAIVLGNALLFVYVGLLSYIAGETGATFAMQSSRVFGSVLGKWFVAVFMSTLVVGWFAFNTGLAGSTMSIAYGWPEWQTTLACSILFIAITFIGARALAILGMIASPLFMIAAIIAISMAMSSTTLQEVINYPGVLNGAGAFSLGAGVTFVFASFADSGTMTADFTRWSKNGREAMIASSAAFPVGNFVAFFAGAIIVATGVIDDPINTGGNFVKVFGSNDHILIRLIGIVFVIVSTGSVATHCLYNGAIGWSHLTKSTMRTMCIVLGIIGGIAATAGIWHNFGAWLGILGIFVAPIGTVVIVSLFMGRSSWSKIHIAEKRVKGEALISYIAGAFAAILTHRFAPQLSEAFIGILVSGIFQVVLITLTRKRYPDSETLLDQSRSGV